MKRRTIFAVMIGSLGLGTAVYPTIGYPVTFEFAGEITYVEDDDGLLGGAVAIGSPFSGLYTFESTTPDSNPGEPTLGVYNAAITSVTTQVGSLPIQGPVGPDRFLYVLDLEPSQLDEYFVFTEVEPDGMLCHFSLELVDDSGTALQGDSLPVAPPDLASFDYATLLVTGVPEVFPVHIQGELTSLVPEPGTIALLGTSALLVAKRRSGRRPAQCSRRR